MLDEDVVSLKLGSLPLGGCKGPALLLLFQWTGNREGEGEGEALLLNIARVMSLVSWYDSIPFHFRIFSISTPMLTYHDAWN